MPNYKLMQLDEASKNYRRGRKYKKYNLRADVGIKLGIVQVRVGGGVEWGDKPTLSCSDQFEYIDEIRKLRNDVYNLSARMAVFEDSIPRLLKMRSLSYPGYRRLLNDASQAARGSGLEGGVISLPRKTLLPSALTNLRVINPQSLRKVRYCKQPGCNKLALLIGGGYCPMHHRFVYTDRGKSASSVTRTTFCSKHGCRNLAFGSDTCFFHSGVPLTFIRRKAAPLKHCKHPGCKNAVVSSMSYCLEHLLSQKFTMLRCKQPGCSYRAHVDGNCLLHSLVLKYGSSTK